MTDTHDDIIQKARLGNEVAFSVLVKEYTPFVYRTAYALLQDRAEAEDASQEVFFKVYRALGQLSEVRTFHAWLKTITTRTCLDRLRKQRPQPMADLELERLSINFPQHFEERIQIRDALRQLSTEYREVLILREWHGYDYQEIATLLNIPLGTVKSRIHSARLNLRKLLKD